MSYITVSFVIVVTLSCCGSDYVTTYVRENTSVVSLKQGFLQGVVVAFRTNHHLLPVEQYKGIPYAEPPVGEFRFMPPGSPPGFGPKGKVKFASAFGPVCPQKFPDTTKMTLERRSEFFRLQQYLKHQSEDCLYLNLYVPFRGKSSINARSYPVMVFLHGESFEWNSGNPYDGSVLASYGRVIVVTLNYRLGVLGFLKAGTEEYSKSNFGLVDQIAALLWVKDNIAAFGGDPNTVTLFGHGTGAVCANLLMLSPMVLQEQNKTLFQRAILMSGSALSDWALVGHPLHVTYQVAQALNCQIQDDFASCLRGKRFEEIMNAPALTSPYRTRLGPVVDSLVVPNDPKKLMTTYNDMFKRFELMYGVTELESIHLLPADALKLGMLEKDRDQELRRYLRSQCEIKYELCFTKTLMEYSRTEFSMDEPGYGYSGHEPDKATLARDALLDVLSDARTVAPMVQMGKYHSGLNKGSYFYVYTHKTRSKEYIRDKSFTGEELPYVFGVPLVGSSFHFTDHYTERERLFSEVVMTHFANFAHTGDPKMPRKNEYYTLNINDWIHFDVDWRPFDSDEQWYLQLGIPPHPEKAYREDQMRFWNEIIPNITYYSDSSKPLQTFNPERSRPPWILDRFENFHKPYLPTQGIIRVNGTAAPDNMMGNVVYGTVRKTPSLAPSLSNNESRGISTTMTIAMCSIFLLSNICLFVVLYLTCYRRRKRNVNKHEETHSTMQEVHEAKLMDGCNIMKIVSKSERSEDTYEAVKSSKGGFKLPRQMSSSTIDAHTKVRDWITNEMVYKYSPRFLRRSRKNQNNISLGRSDTRPATPTEPVKPRPPLVKSSSIPVQNKNKCVEKISVAIDATPSGRGPSVLAQQPIELTKSLDRPNFEPLRRSLTMDDLITVPINKQDLRKSTTSINLKFSPQEEPTVIRIEHSHSKSDPVQDYTRKLKTFDPNYDVNVTCCDNEPATVPLTPEESLMTIKRRNFPKVLPDYPSRETLAKNRRSMPVPFSAIPELGKCNPNSFARKNFKLPPTPPARTTSTLTRKNNSQGNVCTSAPMLAQEPPPSPEPEVVCNNLYMGPLIPKLNKTDSTTQIYDSLKAAKARTVVTTDPYQPIKRVEPRLIIKPTVNRNVNDCKKNIPRVNLTDEEGLRKVKSSQIPTLVKEKETSSESSPSEKSDTGTVKRVT